jgi:hypothetical protein
MKSFYEQGKCDVAERRIHMRIDDEERCHLRLNDSHYLAMVKNISLSGALVDLNFPPESLQAGNTCQLSVDGGDLYNYDCEIVRVENTNIALKFIGMN